MNDLSYEELKTVFQLCQPNKKGLISLKTFQNLLDQYTNQLHGELSESKKEILTDFQEVSSNGEDWITFEEFCQGVSSFIESPKISDNRKSSQHRKNAALKPILDFDEEPSRCQTIRSQETPVSPCSENLLINFDEHPSGPSEEEFLDYLSLRPDQISRILQPRNIADHYPKVESDMSNQSPLRIDVMSSPGTADDDDVIGNSQDGASPYSLTDSAMGGSAMSPEPQDGTEKSHCSSISDDREVNFESYGENNDVEYDNDLVDFDDVDSPDKSDSSFQRNSSNLVRRNAWMRTSLRRSPANHDQLVPPRRWGSFRHPKRVSSNAYASALYHQNGGANSSGRSSNCDDGDMHSDISLEDDVIDLNQKVQLLQNQVGQLAESQANTDDKYSKVRQENVNLNQRIHVLEEQIREMDQRASEQLADEQKRNRDIISRLEREKQLEIENYAIKLQSIEREYNSSVREVSQLRTLNERLKSEKNSIEQELFETQQNLTELKKEFHKLQELSKRETEQANHEKRMTEHLVEELSKELESLKSSSSFVRSESVIENGISGSILNGLEVSSQNSHIHELEEQLRELRDRNHRLQESNDELEAVLMNKSLEQGKALISQSHIEGTSIEMELRNMDDSQEFSDTSLSIEEVHQLRTALKDQQEVNSQLRSYIDGILMNIIDKYPELLEVRK